MAEATHAAADHGPYLELAVLCERVLEERDGVLSLVRLVDRLEVTVPGPAGAAGPAALAPVQLFAVVGFKSGQARGRHQLRLTLERPDGLRRLLAELPLLFEGEDRGARHCGGRLLTRTRGTVLGRRSAGRAVVHADAAAGRLPCVSDRLTTGPPRAAAGVPVPVRATGGSVSTTTVRNRAAASRRSSASVRCPFVASASQRRTSPASSAAGPEPSADSHARGSTWSSKCSSESSPSANAISSSSSWLCRADDMDDIPRRRVSADELRALYN